MSFEPSIHGWPFSDALTVDPAAQGAEATPSLQFGLGAGMCWTALDRYLGGVRIARDTASPSPGDHLHAELVRRQASALCGHWPRVREWQALTDRKLAAMSRATLRGIRNTIKSGEPVLLTLLPEADPYVRGRAARYVLATAWSRVGKQVTLSIYDPARPNDNGARLRCSSAGPLDARLASGQAVRGFFPVPYDLRPPSPWRAETFGDRAVLGLARPVQGRIAATATGARLDMVARGTDGSLLHFRRAGGKPWEGANVTEREGFGQHEMHGDPAILAMRGSLHAFARGYVGDLLHFTLGRKWSAANRSEQKRTGPRFRLAGIPVPLAGAWGRLHVFGRDKDSGIVHYEVGLLRRWSAEQIAGDPIVGDPVALRTGDTIHLFGVAADGRVLHWERTGKEWAQKDWVPRNLSSHDQSNPPLRLAGPLVALVHGEAIHLVGRDAQGRLGHFRRSPAGEWRSIPHDIEIAGDPAITTGPAGVHVFGAGPEGQLLHRWGDEDWQGEDVSATRASLDLPGSPPAQLTGWGGASELNVLGRWGDQLVHLTWREDSDWIAVPFRSRVGVETRHVPAADPIVVTDRRGTAHLFGTDGKGSVIHVEPGDRPRPARSARAAAAVLQPRAPRSARPRAVQPQRDPDSVLEPPREPVPALDPEAPPAPAPEPEALPLLDFPGPDAGTPAMAEPDGAGRNGGTPDVVGAEAAEDVVVWEPSSLDEPPQPEPGSEPTTPTATPAPVGAKDEPEPGDKAMDQPKPTGKSAGKEPASEEPAGGAEKPKRRPQDFEPMDLTSLEMVPPEPRRRRQRKKG